MYVYVYIFSMFICVYKKYFSSEALRMWPPAFILDRVCTKPFTVQDKDTGGVPLEKGDLLIVSAFGIHRDPKYYPNPDQFDPERFSDENKGNINPYIYMPFGLGPRACIGIMNFFSTDYI